MTFLVKPLLYFFIISITTHFCTKACYNLLQLSLLFLTLIIFSIRTNNTQWFNISPSHIILNQISHKTHTKINTTSWTLRHHRTNQKKKGGNANHNDNESLVKLRLLFIKQQMSRFPIAHYVTPDDTIKRVFLKLPNPNNKHDTCRGFRRIVFLCLMYLGN